MRYIDREMEQSKLDELSYSRTINSHAPTASRQEVRIRRCWLRKSPIGTVSVGNCGRRKIGIDLCKGVGCFQLTAPGGLEDSFHPFLGTSFVALE